MLIVVSQLTPFVTCVEFGGRQVSSALTDAEEAMASAYQAVFKAEETGANVSSLVVKLNESSRFLAQANTAYRSEKFDQATIFANLSRNIAMEVQSAAVELKESATRDEMLRSLLTMTASVIGIAIIALGSLSFWRLSKKRYERIFHEK